MLRLLGYTALKWDYLLLPPSLLFPLESYGGLLKLNHLTLVLIYGNTGSLEMRFHTFGITISS